ncbi:hypothetical protein M8818_007913 [Zalaria obscura]|uniref:Uncharacterized protein n=1 Tax=Zalaria obscura TaxID=2024903 RepID=A0ACC3S3U7_9PEZI
MPIEIKEVLPLQPRKDSDLNSKPVIRIEQPADVHPFDESPSMTVLPSLDKQRISAAPTASSVYSREFREPADDVWSQIQLPPQQPRPRTQGTVESGSVSRTVDSYNGVPSEESTQTLTSAVYGVAKEVPQPRSKQSLGSRITGLRRAKSNLSKAAAPAAPKNGTRWDEYLGEPIFNDSGKPSQVNPPTFADHFGSKGGSKPFGVSVSITGPSEKPRKASFTEKAAQLGKDVTAVDRRTSNPFTIRRQAAGPRKGSYNMIDSDSEVSRDSADARQSERSISRSQTSPVSNSTMSHDETPRPIIVEPLKITKRQQQHIQPAAKAVDLSTTNYPSPVSLPSLSALSTSSPLANRSTSISRKPVASPSIRTVTASGTATPPSRDSDHSYDRLSDLAQHPSSHFSWTTYAPSLADPQSPTYPLPKTVTEREEPRSHFSWTTVNTSMTYQHSPPPSPPPIPEEYASSIMSRKRPIPKDKGPQPLKDTTNATAPPTPPASSSPTAPTAPTAQTSSDTTKALPALPNHLPPNASRVDVLTAQLNDLQFQHNNLARLIAETLKIDFASPLVVDERTRREARKRLEELRERLGDVEREEHEVGRKLTRARRRVEREEGEGSGLWVRRVTG